MVTALQVLIYGAALFFAIACAVRAVAYARAPIHLRWELYPVPHEAPEQVAHGGSYFEHGDWWTRPRACNRLCELRFMLLEMVFLKGLWEFNRPLWFRSFPFHFGLYLLAATVVLLAAAALTGAPLHALYVTTGLGGAVSALAGAAGLLARRLSDPRLRTYTTGADLFNLAFFLVVLGCLVAGYAVERPQVLGIARDILTFGSVTPVKPLFGAGLALGALLAAYIPCTHMAHFIAKYFTYHSIRWDDAVNVRGGKLEHRIAEYLTYRPTWAAPHVGADGARTWADVAMLNPAQKGKA